MTNSFEDQAQSLRESYLRMLQGDPRQPDHVGNQLGGYNLTQFAAERLAWLDLEIEKLESIVALLDEYKTERERLKQLIPEQPEATERKDPGAGPSRVNEDPEKPPVTEELPNVPLTSEIPRPGSRPREQSPEPAEQPDEQTTRGRR